MYRRPRPFPGAMAWGALLGALCGCGDYTPPDSEPPPVKIEVSPPGECRAGEPLENGIAGRVLEFDPPHNPVAGVKVDYSGEGLMSSSATSDADGVVRVGFTCPTIAGVGADVILSLYDVRAQYVASVGPTLPGPPARSYKLLLPAPPAMVTIVSGNSQAGQVGGILALPLEVVARDQFGNPLCLPITWVASDGGSPASGTTTPTGSACIASNTMDTRLLARDADGHGDRCPGREPHIHGDRLALMEGKGA